MLKKKFIQVYCCGETFGPQARTAVSRARFQWLFCSSLFLADSSIILLSAGFLKCLFMNLKTNGLIFSFQGDVCCGLLHGDRHYTKGRLV